MDKYKKMPIPSYQSDSMRPGFRRDSMLPGWRNRVLSHETPPSRVHRAKPGQNDWGKPSPWKYKRSKPIKSKRRISATHSDSMRPGFRRDSMLDDYRQSIKKRQQKPAKKQRRSYAPAGFGGGMHSAPRESYCRKSTLVKLAECYVWECRRRGYTRV